MPLSRRQHPKGRQADPGFEPHLVEGRAHFRRGAFTSALRELTTAQSRDPTRPEVHRLLGLCHARQGRAEEACVALREALRLNPLDFVARGALGILLSQDGDPGSAIDELKRGMAVLQEQASTTSMEARALVNLGRLPDALTMLRRAAWLRLGGSVLQYYLDWVSCDHCLLELAFRDWEPQEAVPDNGSPRR